VVEDSELVVRGGLKRVSQCLFRSNIVPWAVWRWEKRSNPVEQRVDTYWFTEFKIGVRADTINDGDESFIFDLY